MATKKESEKQQKQNQVEEKAHQEHASSKAIAADAQAEFDISHEIDELMQSLSGDLGSIELEDAMGLIDHWHGFLSQAKVGGTKELAAELKNLQKVLKGGKATGHEISEVLIHIGEQTAEFSGEAEKGSKQSVQRLGKQLRTAGTSIAKAEDQEIHQQLDTIVDHAESNELTSMDTEAAVGAIDFWYALLSKAEGEQFKSVANSLKSLKQTLSKDSAKPETIAKALGQLGEQTREVATEVPRGFKGVIQKLGQQLGAASELLTQTEKAAK